MSSYLNENLLDDVKSRTAEAIAQVRISSRSKWGDKVWYLDIYTPGRHRTVNLIDWEKTLPDGSLLTDPKHAHLLETCKRLILILLSDPPLNQRKLDIATIPRVASSLFILIRWMVSNGYLKFRDLDESAIDRYVAYCRNRPGRPAGTKLKPGSIHILLMPISYLYAERKRLPDAIEVQPFGGEPASAAAGHLTKERVKIPAIPDEIAVDIIRKALTWVEKYSNDIIAARSLYIEEYGLAIAQGLKPRNARTRASKKLHEFARSTSLIDYFPDHKPFTGKRSLNQLIHYLLAACFICIAGLVGMRISEILSLCKGFIEYGRTPDDLTEIIYVRGRTYKKEDDPRGRETRWVAPTPIVMIADVLERLSAPLRKKAKKPDKSKVFLTDAPGQDSGMTLPTIEEINKYINQFARIVKVPLYKGKVWRFSSHQFRKTFARFVGRRDKTCLHALSQHFKHVSLTMTDSYVGSDFELHELIGEAQWEETRQALDRILGAETLAGKLAEEILARNHRFRGRAGSELRKDFVEFILSETDMVILSHEYAMCVVLLETALCGGDTARVGRSVCINCPNFLVGEEHIPYWEDHKKRNHEVLERLKDQPALIQAPVLAEIKQADDILVRIRSCETKDDQKVE